MKNIFGFLILSLLAVLIFFIAFSKPITPPKLTNNPSLDVIVTQRQPLFSFFNAENGLFKRTYVLQIDKVATFNSPSLVEYRNIPEETQYITSKRIEEKDRLEDNQIYYWRVKAVDSIRRESPWAQSRFFLNTEADDAFMNLVRIPVVDVQVSSGQNPKNIVDIDDPGQVTFWQSNPPGASVQWVKFDLGKIQEISRIWILSNPTNPDGWLKDFVWQRSDDGEMWTEILGTSIKNNDTFRNIINFPAIKARYARLLITEWHGFAPEINAIILYSPGNPPLPKTPEGDYVLIVGNQQNGFTFSELASFVESLGFGLKTLVVPHYEVSLNMIEKLTHKPVAIILSGNNADYPNLPMFEFNGEYEIIRQSKLPILGICCGHQQLAMAYGYTNARSMGWSDISSLKNIKHKTRAYIKKKDPIFKNMPNPFVAVEIHGWAVAKHPVDFEVLAESPYVQAIKSKSRMIYGEQFHAEIKTPNNEGTPYLVNFLEMALKRQK